MNTTNSFNNNTDSGNLSGGPIFRLIDTLMPYFWLLLLISNLGVSTWMLFRVYNIQDINRKLQNQVDQQKQTIDYLTTANSKIDRVLLNQEEGKTRSVIQTSVLDTVKAALINKKK